MIYKELCGERISSLGLGCMRFPLADPDTKEVDMSATDDLIACAIQNGINYFDTAWPYHNDKSESILGELLAKYPRESYFLATKYPAFEISNMKDPAAIFEKQLANCKTDYFDFYLCHNVCERNIDWFTDPQYGVVEYLIEQKKKGRIRHLGFSTHGSRTVIRRFIDAYRSELEFCQIQLNYLDWKLQSAKEKVEMLTLYGLPIWVMEPVRGGRLAELDSDTMCSLAAFRPDASAAEWAFRFLQTIPGIGVILSGMSNMDQLTENINTFSASKPLSKAEMRLILKVSDDMIAKRTVPCTACGYCLTKCPRSLPIPDMIKAFNEKTAFKDASPDSCIACRSCESVCPQGIKISEVMELYKNKIKEGAFNDQD